MRTYRLCSCVMWRLFTQHKLEREPNGYYYFLRLFWLANSCLTKSDRNFSDFVNNLQICPFYYQASGSAVGWGTARQDRRLRVRFPMGLSRFFIYLATRYGLDDPGIEFRLWRDFPRLSVLTLESTEPPIQWVPGLIRGVNHPPSSGVEIKERVELYLYSPLGFHGRL